MNITTEIIRELLDYNQNTGVFTWKARGREWFTRDQYCNSCNAKYAGKAAGYVSKDTRGYPALRIRVLNKPHIAARLAFLWMGEPLPEQVDHLNGDSLDNRWLNLKSSTNAENLKNQSMYRSNTSGVCGVLWNEKMNKWRAQVRSSGKRHHLGYFDEDDLDRAAMEVMEFRAENGFTARHGQAPSTYQRLLAK